MKRKKKEKKKKKGQSLHLITLPEYSLLTSKPHMRYTHAHMQVHVPYTRGIMKAEILTVSFIYLSKMAWKL